LTAMADRTEMAHSVEGRTPFLDHPLVEFSCSLPSSWKVDGDAQKVILRESVRPYVDEDLYHRRKQHFIPPAIRLSSAGKLTQLLQDTLRSARARDLPFYRQKDMIAMLDRCLSLDHGSAEYMRDSFIFPEILGLCLMQEKFIGYGVTSLSANPGRI
jgi:asparagine synthase (glutamine-hydrolysing)